MTATLVTLALALLILLLCWLNRHLDAPEDQTEVLRQSAFIRGTFLLSVLGFAAVAIGLPLTTGETTYSPYCAAMALFAALIGPFGFLSCIRYGNSGLTIRTAFGRVYALRWEDITAVKPGASYNPQTQRRQDGYIIADGRKFFVNYSMHGAEDFIARAQECLAREQATAQPGGV